MVQVERTKPQVKCDQEHSDEPEEQQTVRFAFQRTVEKAYQHRCDDEAQMQVEARGDTTDGVSANLIEDNGEEAQHQRVLDVSAVAWFNRGDSPRSVSKYGETGSGQNFRMKPKSGLDSSRVPPIRPVMSLSTRTIPTMISASRIRSLAKKARIDSSAKINPYAAQLIPYSQKMERKE